MTLTLDTIQFITPFAPPMQTAAHIRLPWESFSREFPQSILQRLWARLYFGSSRAVAVVVRIVNTGGDERVAGCTLTWRDQSDSCFVQMRVDPVSFEIESGTNMEILRQTWR